MIKRFSLFCLLQFALWVSVFSQTESDKAHGALTPLRNCFDVTYYEIALQVYPDKQHIEGANRMSFKVMEDCDKLQLDFAGGMNVTSMILDEKDILKYERNQDIIVVTLGRTLKKGASHKLLIEFSGSPRIASNPPWDGGFVWKKDSKGYDWVGLACESIGASSWLPCKDHWSDEADSMEMTLIVPKDLTGVSNGKLISVSPFANNCKAFTWKVCNPINNYNISVNVGRYSHITDFYDMQAPEPLSLDYYVLEESEAKAIKHFGQVKTMLACFGKYFGPYPFWKDGYKLVETSYWGMEHQSCVAYGNHYRNNSFNFDFIIIHESGHEWFANSITANDPAEMWIHESFTTYSEALYVECTMNYDSAVKYLEGQKRLIVSKKPMIGPRDVYYHGFKDNDIYYKGTWMLHTMRSVLNNDSLWFSALRGFCSTFRHKIISTKDVEAYFTQATGYNWNMFFRQYLYNSQLPELEYSLKTKAGKTVLSYKWKNVLKGFSMPVEIQISDTETIRLNATGSAQKTVLDNSGRVKYIKVRTDRFLVKTKS